MGSTKQGPRLESFDAAAVHPYLCAMTALVPLSRMRNRILLAVLAAAATPAAVGAQGKSEGAPPAITRPDNPPVAEPAPRSEAPPAPGKKGEQAEETPEQHAKLLDELYARLATAPDEATAAQIASAIEQLWQHSGSATADLLVARASAATEAQRRDLAMKLLNAAVELQPDYAEAWNRRAYLFFLADDYKRALGDLRRVLALEPRHYKALEGLANILQHLGEKKAALEAYDALLKVYPNRAGARKARDDLRIEVEGQGI